MVFATDTSNGGRHGHKTRVIVYEASHQMSLDKWHRPLTELQMVTTVCVDGIWLKKAYGHPSALRLHLRPQAP